MTKKELVIRYLLDRYDKQDDPSIEAFIDLTSDLLLMPKAQLKTLILNWRDTKVTEKQTELTALPTKQKAEKTNIQDTITGFNGVIL